MNRRFWLGATIGALSALGLHAAAVALLTRILQHADMAEARTWTAEDDDLRMFFYDLNGQQP